MTPTAPKVSTRFDEERDLYELGAEIDGAFVSFASVPGSDVRATIEAETGEAKAAA